MFTHGTHQRHGPLKKNFVQIPSKKNMVQISIPPVRFQFRYSPENQAAPNWHCPATIRTCSGHAFRNSGAVEVLNLPKPLRMAGHWFIHSKRAPCFSAKKTYYLQKGSVAKCQSCTLGFTYDLGKDVLYHTFTRTPKNANNLQSSFSCSGDTQTPLLLTNFPRQTPSPSSS